MFLHLCDILFTGSGGVCSQGDVCLQGGLHLGDLPPGGVRKTPQIRCYGIWSTSGRYASYCNALLLPSTNEVCEGYVFTRVCLSTVGGSTPRPAGEVGGLPRRGVQAQAGGRGWGRVQGSLSWKCYFIKYSILGLFSMINIHCISWKLFWAYF